MRSRVAIGAALAAVALGCAAPVTAQAPTSTTPAFAPRDERVEDLPAGPGRDETFGLCSACHAYRLVSNQGMTRERWDGTLDWMTERHAMPKLEGEDRALILDYLVQAHPPKTAGSGGFRNPFSQ